MEDKNKLLNILKGRQVRKEFIIIPFILMIILVFAGRNTLGKEIKAYRVYLKDEVENEEIVLTLRTEEEIQEGIEELEIEILEEKGKEIKLEDSVKIEEVLVKKDEIKNKEILKEEIKEKIEDLVPAYELEIDGEQVGILETEEELEKILTSIKEDIVELDESVDLVEFKINNEVHIKPINVLENKLSLSEDIENKLRYGRQEVEIYKLEEGDNYWTISEDKGLDYYKLLEDNEAEESDTLQIGDEVRIIKEFPLIDVVVKEEFSGEEDIEFEIVEELDENMYEDEEEILEEGKLGKKHIVKTITRINNEFVEEEVLEEEILEEPVAQLVKKGTKERPKTDATGSFMMPISGRLTSRFGPRWGRMHRGIDIATPYGKTMYAADGGTVTYASTNGSYGKLIEINHGNGYVTRYAHCGEILVSNGEKVYKGQEIGKVGMTGRTTGPHLHFEIIENGSHVDPLKLIE